LPSVSYKIAVPAPTDSGVPNNGGLYFTSMLAASGPVNGPTDKLISFVTVPGASLDQVFLGIQYFTGGTNQPHVRVYRFENYAVATPTFPPIDNIFSVDSIGFATLPNPGPLNKFAGQTHFTTRINPTDYTQIGTPVFVFDNNLGRFDNNGETGIVIFPNPNTPTVSQPWVYSFARAVLGGQLIGHQGRIVILQYTSVTLSGWQGSTGQIITNDALSFSDPPNSLPPGNFPTQNEVFVPEYSTGYGCWGTMSISELLLIKHKGGAVYVTGDIANPTVTHLPGVISTGGLISQCAPTPVGLMYPTATNGMYLWNGGNTSQKISNQLDDGFFLTPQVIPNFGVQVQVEPWNEWILVSNNWLYDTVTQGWWRLEDPTQTTNTNIGIPSPGPVFSWYARSYQDNLMYAAVGAYLNSPASEAIWVYDRTKPASTFSWQSHPIPVTTERLVDVRELVLLAQGQGIVSVTLTDTDGNVQANGPDVFAIKSPTIPQRLRLRTSITGYNIIVRIQSEGTSLTVPGTTGSTTATPGPAPVVYELDVGWVSSAMTGRV
jgi:hypothetical protein